MSLINYRKELSGTMAGFYAGALTLGVAALPGCATISRVSGLEQRMGALETRPYIERSITVTPKQYSTEFSALRDIVLAQYENSKIAAVAKQRTNAIEVTPVGSTEYYQVVLFYDADSNGKPTIDKDHVFPDQSGRTAFLVPKGKIPKSLLKEMIDNK